MKAMNISIVAVCGMPGSGKGEFSRVVEKFKIPIFSMGDMVREELRSRGLVETPENVGYIAVDLREKFGEGVLAKRLVPYIENKFTENGLIIIEGIRGVAEYEVFKEQWNDKFKILAIESDTEIRWNRIKIRGRGDDGDREAFDVRDLREKSWGLERLLSLSDIQIKNNSEIVDFEIEVQRWLNNR